MLVTKKIWAKENGWEKGLTESALLSEGLAAPLPVASQGLLVTVDEHMLGKRLLGGEPLLALLAFVGLACHSPVSVFQTDFAR
jgi:hypothetical protein